MFHLVLQCLRIDYGFKVILSKDKWFPSYLSRYNILTLCIGHPLAKDFFVGPGHIFETLTPCS